MQTSSTLQILALIPGIPIKPYLLALNKVSTSFNQGHAWIDIRPLFWAPNRHWFLILVVVILEYERPRFKFLHILFFASIDKLKCHVSSLMVAKSTAVMNTSSLHAREVNRSSCCWKSSQLQALDRMRPFLLPVWGIDGRRNSSMCCLALTLRKCCYHLFRSLSLFSCFPCHIKSLASGLL